MEINYYTILGVSSKASSDEIRIAYRKLALKWHPDKNHSPEAEERFKEINEAYHFLIDNAKRKQYDDCISSGQKWHEYYTQADANKQFNEEMLRAAFELILSGIPLDEIIGCLMYNGLPFTLANKIANEIYEIGKDQIEDICNDIKKVSYKRIFVGILVAPLFPFAGIANLLSATHGIFKSRSLRKNGMNLKFPISKIFRHIDTGRIIAICPTCNKKNWLGPVFGKDSYICKECFSIYRIDKKIQKKKIYICESCKSMILYNYNLPTKITCQQCSKTVYVDKKGNIDKTPPTCLSCNTMLKLPSSIIKKDKYLIKCSQCNAILTIYNRKIQRPKCVICGTILKIKSPALNGSFNCSTCKTKYKIHSSGLQIIYAISPCPICSTSLKLRNNIIKENNSFLCPECETLLIISNNKLQLPICPICKQSLTINRLSKDIKCTQCKSVLRWNSSKAILNIISQQIPCPSCHISLKIPNKVLNIDNNIIKCVACNALIKIVDKNLEKIVCPICQKSSLIKRKSNNEDIICTNCSSGFVIKGKNIKTITIVKKCPYCNVNIRIKSSILKTKGINIKCPNCQNKLSK